MASVSVPLVFLAGVLSFVSSCLLPMVPIYLGYLSGASLAGDEASNRWRLFSHAVLFVAGFTATFVILFGLPATVLSHTLQRYSSWITRVGGVVLILFGLHVLKVITIPVLNKTRRAQMGSRTRPGFFRSVLFGVTFAAGWTPCIGPLLGTVMTLAFTEPSRAMGLLLLYALGLAVPFLATAALLTQATSWLKRFNRQVRAVEIASGLLMVGTGILLVSGGLSVLNGYLIRITPDWLWEHM
ncbi:MAG: cytochrome c biogenesis protein CcdA [Anaerolineales bacterium]|nr:MAG: cytochrome c biogenesis protein CcdA [Anaerolineales bacterium]